MTAATAVRLVARLEALMGEGRAASAFDQAGARLRVQKKRAIRRILQGVLKFPG